MIGEDPPAGSSPGENRGVYLFCFTRPQAPSSIAVEGSDGANPPFLWRCGDIGAVVCEVALSEFCGPSAESNLEDLNWLGPRVCRHEKVIEQVMGKSPVYPARFGTLFSSLDRLKKFVEEHLGMISEWLDYTADKEEWGIKGFMDRGTVEERLIAEAFQTVELPDSPGLRYLARQRLRLETAGEVTSRVAMVREAVLQRLQEDAVESRVLNLRPREGSGRPGEMILSQVFLLARDRLEGFRSGVEGFNAENLGEGFSLEISGPWPPYHFVPR